MLPQIFAVSLLVYKRRECAHTKLIHSRGNDEKFKISSSFLLTRVCTDLETICLNLLTWKEPEKCFVSFITIFKAFAKGKQREKQEILREKCFERKYILRERNFSERVFKKLCTNLWEQNKSLKFLPHIYDAFFINVIKLITESTNNKSRKNNLPEKFITKWTAKIF